MKKSSAAQLLNTDDFYTFTPTPLWVNLSSFEDINHLIALSDETLGELPLLPIAVNNSIFLHNEEETTYHYQFFQKYQSLKGVRENSEIEIEFMPHHQIIEIHRLNVYRHGKIIDKTNSCHIYLNNSVRHHGDTLHTGFGQVRIVINDIQVDDILEFSYSVAGARSSLNKFFNAVFAGGSYTPLLRRQLRIISPKTKKIHWKCHGLDYTPLIHPFSHDQDYDEYTFQLTPQILTHYEEDIPRSITILPYIEITDFSHWHDVYEALKIAYEYSEPLPEQLYHVLERIAQSTQDLEDRIIACINYVQKNFRYQVCSEPLHAIQPFNLSKIVLNGFGDCKDKSLLLVAMLRYFKVKCYPALLNEESPFDPHIRLPSTSVFDHVIVALYFNNHLFWIDPTHCYEEGKLNYRGVCNFGYAFILNEQANAPIWIEQDTYSMRQTHEIYDFSRGDKAPFTLTIITTHKGISANQIRARFANESKKDLSQSYLEYYKGIFPDIRPVGELYITDDQEKNIFVETEKYEVLSVHSLSKDEDQYCIQARSFYSYLKDPAEGKDRYYPYMLSYPIKMQHITEITYPWAIFDKEENHFQEIGDEHIKLFYQDQRRINFQRLTYDFQTLTWAVEKEKISSYMETTTKVYNYTVTLIPENLLNIKWCRKNFPQGVLGKIWHKVSSFFGGSFWWGLAFIGLIRLVSKLLEN